MILSSVNHRKVIVSRINKSMNNKEVSYIYKIRRQFHINRIQWEVDIKRMDFMMKKIKMIAMKNHKECSLTLKNLNKCCN
jgi:hypothetical protein